MKLEIIGKTNECPLTQSREAEKVDGARVSCIHSLSSSNYLYLFW